MTISAGDKIPSLTLSVMGEKGPEPIETNDIFTGKKVVIFAVPGAFTPGCSNTHMPGFVVNADKILDKGVDTIVCTAVNDAFVMGAWGEAQNVGDKILMLGDGNGDFTRAIGLEIDRTASHMGIRSQRYAMIVEDGIVTHLNVEVAPQFEVSDAETMLKLL